MGECALRVDCVLGEQARCVHREAKRELSCRRYGLVSTLVIVCCPLRNWDLRGNAYVLGGLGLGQPEFLQCVVRCVTIQYTSATACLQ